MRIITKWLMVFTLLFASINIIVCIATSSGETLYSGTGEKVPSPCMTQVGYQYCQSFARGEEGARMVVSYIKERLGESNVPEILESITSERGKSGTWVSGDYKFKVSDSFLYYTKYKNPPIQIFSFKSGVITIILFFILLGIRGLLPEREEPISSIIRVEEGYLVGGVLVTYGEIYSGGDES